MLELMFGLDSGLFFEVNSIKLSVAEFNDASQFFLVKRISSLLFFRVDIFFHYEGSFSKIFFFIVTYGSLSWSSRIF